MAAPASDGPVVVKLPADVGARVSAAARHQQRTPEEIVIDACRRLLAVLERGDADEQYQRGYQQIPEDATDAQALLPHLPLPQEDWT
jgi:hypothetical protein